MARKVSVEIVGDASKLERSFRQAATSAQVFNARITSTGRSLTRGLGFAAATAGIAGFGLALRSTIQAAIDFESSFAGVRKTVDATEPEFRELAAGFRQLSREIPISVNELNRIGEAAGQLGVKREAILGFTRTIADLGVATQLTTDQASVSLAQFANIMQTPQENIGRLGAAIVELGNNLATNEPKIVDFGLRIAAAGRLIGLTEPQVLAIGGAFASVGVEAERGGTAISKALLSLKQAVLSGNKNLDTFARTAGLTRDAFRELFAADPAEAFVRFVEGLNQVSKAGGNANAVLTRLGLADVRLVQSFLSIAQAEGLLRRSIELGSGAWRENTALTEEAGKRYATTASELQKFRNLVNDLQITLGEALSPALLEAIEPLSEWLSQTENQKRAQQELNKTMKDARAVFEGVRAVVVPLASATRSFASAIGGLANATELLLVTLVASRVVRFATGLAAVGVAAKGSRAQVLSLRAAMLRLGAIGVIAIGAEFVFNRKAIEDAVDDFLRKSRRGVPGAPSFDFGFLTGKQVELPKGIRPEALKQQREAFAKLRGEGDLMVKALDQAIAAMDASRVDNWRRSIELSGQSVGEMRRHIELATRAARKLAEEQRRAVTEDETPQRRRLRPELRNRIFDIATNRSLDRAQDQELREQLAVLDRIAVSIRQQIAKVKDITRQLNLRDRLLEVQRQARAVRERIAAEFIDSLSLGLERAEITGTFADDLAALSRIEEELRKQIRVSGSTVELERQLLDVERRRRDIREQTRLSVLDALRLTLERASLTRGVQDDLRALSQLESQLRQQMAVAGRTVELERQLLEVETRRAELRKQARDAAQFRLLGLGPTGGELVPGVQALRKSLGSITDAVKGTFLDTGKTRSLLGNIRKLLAGGLGAISDEVRAKVKQMLDDLDKQLKDRQEITTPFRKRNVNAFLQGLGLDPDEIRRLRARLSQVSPQGFVPGVGAGAFGLTLAAGSSTVVLHHESSLDGRVIERSTTTYQQKRKRNNPSQKRGPHAGL